MTRTIDQIEKRRRELQRINFFLIYLLAMVVFGLFFFIDEFNGFFGALKYNIFLRFYFVGFVIAFILYLAQKENQQARFTKEMMREMEEAKDKLAKELRGKAFLTEIGFLVNNLRDNAVLERLFESAMRFFQADGGLVVLRDKMSGWKPPLVCRPEETDRDTIEEITKLITTSGRSFIQPDPGFPEHRPIKNLVNIFAVPLRLEGRLFGLIGFWSNGGVIYDESDLSVLEAIAREAVNSAFAIELVQEKTELFNGLLGLVAKTIDGCGESKDRTSKTAFHARKMARNMNLAKEAVDAIEAAAVLRGVDGLIVSDKKKKSNRQVDSVAVLKSLKFPKRITDILALRRGKNGSRASAEAATGARILAVAEAYVAAITPNRGRAPSPASVLAKLESGSDAGYDPQVLAVLGGLVREATEN